MNTVAVDFFDYGGRKHLVMIDRFSGFPWVKHMRYTTLKDTTTTLLDWFYDWGFPQKIMSDNGPPFQHSFATFCTRYNMQHVTSSPYHPQANGLAEAAVKSMKMLLKKCDETGENFHLALLEWRNTPREDGFSPAQALLGRRQKSLLPARSEALLPIDVEKFMSTRRATRQKQIAAYDKRATLYAPLNPGDEVIVQNPQSGTWDITGHISHVIPPGRSYEIIADGKCIRRNRKFIRLAQPATDDEEALPGQQFSDAVIGEDSPKQIRRSARLANARSPEH